MKFLIFLNIILVGLFFFSCKKANNEDTKYYKVRIEYNSSFQVLKYSIFENDNLEEEGIFNYQDTIVYFSKTMPDHLITKSVFNTDINKLAFQSIDSSTTTNYLGVIKINYFYNSDGYLINSTVLIKNYNNSILSDTVKYHLYYTYDSNNNMIETFNSDANVRIQYQYNNLTNKIDIFSYSGMLTGYKSPNLKSKYILNYPDQITFDYSYKLNSDNLVVEMIELQKYGSSGDTKKKIIRNYEYIKK